MFGGVKKLNCSGKKPCWLQHFKKRFKVTETIRRLFTSVYKQQLIRISGDKMVRSKVSFPPNSKCPAKLTPYPRLSRKSPSIKSSGLRVSKNHQSLRPCKTWWLKVYMNPTVTKQTTYLLWVYILHVEPLFKPRWIETTRFN